MEKNRKKCEITLDMIKELGKRNIFLNNEKDYPSSHSDYKYRLGVIDSLDKLKEKLKNEYCIRTSFAYKDLAFINQIQDGAEWLIATPINGKLFSFESISWKQIINDNEFEKYWKQCQESKHEYIHKYFNELTKEIKQSETKENQKEKKELNAEQELEPIMFKASINIYNSMKNNPDCKPIMLNGEEVYLSVGGFATPPYLLTIDVHYNSKYSESLTTSIPILESFKNEICINPEFQNNALINSLIEADILSSYYGSYKANGKQYLIYAVNTEVLKTYKPFGNAILANNSKEGSVLNKPIEEKDKKSLPTLVSLNIKELEQELEKE